MFIQMMKLIIVQEFFTSMFELLKHAKSGIKFRSNLAPYENQQVKRNHARSDV